MENLHVIRKLTAYVLRYKAKLALLILISQLGVMFVVSKPLPVKLIIDNVLIGKALPAPLKDVLSVGNRAITNVDLLVVCVVALVIITLLSSVLALLVTNLTVALGKQLVFDLSIDFYKKLQRLSVSFYARNSVGDLIQRMNADIFVVYFVVGTIIIPILSSVVSLGAMFYVMSLLDAQLAIIALSVVPLLALALAVFSKPMNDTTQRQYETQGDLSAFIQQSLTSMRMIQAFVREIFMLEKLTDKASIFGHSFARATNVSARYEQVTNLITGLATALLIGLGAYKGLDGHLSAGDLYIFTGYIAALYGPVNALTTAIGAIITIGARGLRVFDIIDSEEIVHEKPNAQKLANPKGTIVFENVSFGYGPHTDQAHQVLQHINLSIEPGQIVALIGPTGAGKTSLISLLTRFYDPWDGRILIDGTDLRDLQLNSLRENIALVMQEPFLFPMSIAENIAFGNPAASRDEIMEAAKKALAHEFISRLPSGYDTPIREGGTSLSGGEKQRICLARAFLKESPIMILDEPTSALDALTEAHIFKKLNQFSAGKTIFIISHRLSTIKHADKIIAIEDGQIVENGTHENLINHNSLYANLYRHQLIS
jgi:ATP-binding cassette subfamily B protein